MKTLVVVLAVAVVLVLNCVQETSAAPVSEMQEFEEPLTSDGQSAGLEDASDGALQTLLNSRQKRDLKCTPYCYPKRDGVFCGVKCTF